ncbi:hypothetical protein ACP70R_041046 [Stipagrostis hirtigluma subsp. patula]
MHAKLLPRFVQANGLAAELAASNLVLYAFIYTPLKQIHPINTWVGAVVGAIPPLLGWAASSTELSLNSMILPPALYYWQIPHFMAAYLCRNDYLAGGYRMFSFADPTGKRTAWASLRNCLYMLPLGLFAYNSSLLTLGLTVGALSFVLEPTQKSARTPWLNFCYTGCLTNKRSTTWLRQMSLTAFSTPSSCLCFCGSIPFLTSTYIRRPTRS